MFIVKKNIEKNEIVVGTSSDLDLYGDTLYVQTFHFLSGIVPLFPFSAKAKIRYRQEDQTCTIYKDENIYRVVFGKPQRAIAQGQICVIYQGDELVMSGVIE